MTQIVHQPSHQKRKSRFASYITCYHSIGAEQPTAVECRWSKDLTSEEQLYQRRVKLTEEWVSLDTGWLGAAYSTVIVDNREGTGLAVIPTQGQSLATAKKAVEISFRDDGVVDLVVLPGTVQPFLSPQRAISLRSRHGDLNCVVSVVPE